MITIGVLNLQGAVSEHLEVTKKAIEKMKLNNEISKINKINVDNENIEIEVKAVRFADEVAKCQGIIISGGESTVIGKLMEERGISKVIKENNISVFGTCAGMVLLSKEIDYNQPTLGLMDISVKRNSFGSQKNSFEKEIQILGNSFQGVFIRAPAVIEAKNNVEVLSKIHQSYDQDSIIAVKQGNHIAMAFHPELTDDTRLHEYYLKELLNSLK
ncbi:MAG: pyridoxal 5'-phosphate synthase glutaminase subunit PdxT [Methanobrevibacter sp.]|jgi:5'-phosphate synthase pdxT subunit|nr:pyridoxal 5'-phosphate synthase glutaminase subunit PdxT [Methanobrevibacter sp.]